MILFHRTLKDGGTFEIGCGFDKPFFRNDEKKHGREIYLTILPVVWYASDDTYRGSGEYTAQSTLHFGWLFFWVYFETFRKWKMEGRR